jgi:hypothetical protein
VRPQTGPAWTGAPDRALIEQCLQGDLLMALATGQNRRDWPAITLSAQMQFGREPTLRAAQRLTPDPAGPTSAGGVLMSANDGGVHEVQVPIHLALGISLGLQGRKNPLPDLCFTPAVKPA